MDWQLIVRELMQAGLSQEAIGQHVGMSQPWVSDLARGRRETVEWQVGQRLIALHKQQVKSERSGKAA